MLTSVAYIKLYYSHYTIHCSIVCTSELCNFTDGEDYIIPGTGAISFKPGALIGSIQCIKVQMVNNLNVADVNSFSLLLRCMDKAVRIVPGFDVVIIRILHPTLEGMCANY